eukprot:TRINITY_DN900_c4_g1_i1.p1 TRINITY_DN900_c4_g1~~TRINITY_DN900_c4_g1_i1.p1  ORF type:complete len:172 (+),score=11.70 TRINITY_DN900_c4_g1_i1:120-635(+)
MKEQCVADDVLEYSEAPVFNWADDYPSEEEGLSSPVEAVLKDDGDGEAFEEGSWRCSCLFLNREKYKNRSCYRCGQERPSRWTCAVCRFVNHAKYNNKMCFRCKRRQETTGASTDSCSIGYSCNSSGLVSNPDTSSSSQAQTTPKQRKRGARAGKKVKERQKAWEDSHSVQ